MKAIFAAVTVGICRSATANPLAKVLDLIGELEAKVIQEGEAEVKAFKEYVEWCDDVAKNGKFAIEDATKQKDKLQADIAKLTGDIQTNDQKISDLAASISQADGELKDASLIRDKEQKDFATSEGELMDVIDTLERAVGILEKESAKHPAAFAQVQTGSMASVLQALSSVLDAAAFSSKDRLSVKWCCAEWSRKKPQFVDCWGRSGLLDPGNPSGKVRVSPPHLS
jgi:chromosome segregation ATPase